MTEENLIEKAEQAAERLEHANVVAKDLLARQEALEARKTLGGRSVAGTSQPELSQEEKDRISTKNLFKGTPIEKAFR